MGNSQPSSLVSQPRTPAASQNTVKDAYQGIKGWLILPLIGLFCMLFMTVGMMFDEFLQIKTAWPLATDASSEFYVAGFSSAFYLLQSGLSLFILLLVWTFIAALRWKKSAKALFIVTMLLFIIMILVARFIFPGLFGLEINYGNIIHIVNASFYCVLWVPYFLVSSRVKNTFIR